MLQPQLLHPISESVVVSVGGVGQHRGARHVLLDRQANLFKRNLRLGLKTDFFGTPVCFLRPAS
jgi:hypothetical protein